jgi:hypothetical protein
MVKTTKIQGGADYAKVSDRLKAFRAENPRALIETTPIPQEGGMMMFKARILKDKADENSAESTGHALQTKAGTKDFEKLETIAVGRALALLGYAVDGEIASSEEMEEFENYKQTQKEATLFEMQEKICEIDNIKDLKELWEKNQGLGKEFVGMVNARKAELTHVA